jgi:poly(A) polymerase
VPARVTFRLEPSLREFLSQLADQFRLRGIEPFAVGGFIRDALSGRPVRDLDLVISIDPLEMGRRVADSFGGHYFPLDEERRHARVLLSQPALQIDLLPIRRTIEEDVLRRDFTIDAMAARLKEVSSGSAVLTDPSDGRRDLRRRLIRAVSEEALREDPLRALRGVRLAAELDFRIEPATADLIRRHAPTVTTVSPERQRDELMRIFATPRAGLGVRLLEQLSLLDSVIPELVHSRDVEQPKEHYWDVLNHDLETVGFLDTLLAHDEPRGRPRRRLWRELWGQLSWWSEGRAHFRGEIVPGMPREAVIKLCGLVHDIAKPDTKSFDETGRMRFFGHADVGAEKVGDLLRRLHYPSRVVAHVQAMVQAHLRPVQMAQQGPPTRRAIYRFFRDCGDAGIDTLVLSLADHLGTVGPRLDMEGWRQHVSLVNYIVTKRFQEEAVIAPPRLLRGDELMAELRLTPGPVVGRLIEAIREAQAAGEINNREEALALARSTLRTFGAGATGGANRNDT